MFNIKDSKLYSQIMESLVGFFGLSKESATEAEIHDALNGIDPLETQIENAKLEAAKDLAEVKDRLAKLEAQVSDFEKAIEAKDARIGELQTDAQTAVENTAVEVAALKERHAKEISVLAGQVSALKAGRKHETDEGSETHAAAVETNTRPGVMSIKSNELSALVKRASEAAKN
jgi:phage shock protein A